LAPLGLSTTAIWHISIIMDLQRTHITKPHMFDNQDLLPSLPTSTAQVWVSPIAAGHPPFPIPTCFAETTLLSWQSSLMNSKFHVTVQPFLCAALGIVHLWTEFLG
jgi:hypothetical protein